MDLDIKGYFLSTFNTSSSWIVNYFFDINPILIATIPIPNKALDLLLVMRNFIGYLLSNK